jgi:HEAT repeat protein
LLKVIPSIDTANPHDIQMALPFISTALGSKKENLAVEAVFALCFVSRRPDGAMLLGFQHVSEIGTLLSSSDDRLSGGAMEALNALTPTAGDSTLPLLVQFVNGPTKPNFTKVEAASTVLQYRKTDPAAMKAVEKFLGTLSETSVHAAMLQALGRDRVNTPATDAFVLQGLSDPNKFIRVAAIHATRALGPEVWNRAHTTVIRLATDPGEDNEVKAAAEQELRNPQVP